MRSSIALITLLVAAVSSLPLPVQRRAPLSPDPAGTANIGNGQGKQFITGQCLSDKDCASGCCAVLGDIGICSGPAVSFAQGKAGCGFGGSAAAAPPAASNPPASSGSTSGSTTAATGQAASGLKPDPAGVKNIGNGAGSQFIGGQCLGQADCGSGCCATLPLTDGTTIGICSGPGAQTQAGKQGCGFSSSGSTSSKPATSSNTSSNSGKVTTAPASTTPATGAAASGLKPDPAGVKNIGNGAGSQFIGGQCLGQADCASGCCATLPLTDGTTIGICSGPGAQTQAGKQGCGFSSSGSSLTSSAPATSSNTSSNSGKVTTAPATTPATGAAASGLKPDPAGVKNIGNGAGGQFITGQCLSNADCGSGCCATLPLTDGTTIGICSGPGAQTQAGKQGCGFSSTSLTSPSKSPAAASPAPAAGSSGSKLSTPATGAAASGLKPDPAGVKNLGNGAGKQFIGGQCLNSSDCGSTCCATLPLTDGTTIGICSGPGAQTQAGKQGCGFSV